jgi:hypothetical protein
LTDLSDLPSYQFAGLSANMLSFLVNKLPDEAVLLADFQLVKLIGGFEYFYRLKGRWPELQEYILRIKEKRVLLETQKDIEVIKEIREEMAQGIQK